MNTFKQISVQEAHGMLGSGKVTVIDIRDAGSFNQGHIAHAINLNDQSTPGFLKEADKKIPLICYCYHGISSQRAAGYLAAQGFKDVYSIEGGWEAWEAIYG